MEEADYLLHFLHKSLYLNYNKKKIRRSKFCFLVFIRSQYVSAHSERPRLTVHLNVFKQNINWKYSKSSEFFAVVCVSVFLEEWTAPFALNRVVQIPCQIFAEGISSAYANPV